MIQVPNEKLSNIKVVPLDLSFPKKPNFMHFGQGLLGLRMALTELHDWKKSNAKNHISNCLDIQASFEL
jgi:hypothetical protein